MLGDISKERLPFDPSGQEIALFMRLKAHFSVEVD